MSNNLPLRIRPIHEEDLFSLWKLMYKESSPEWKKWDAPYFEHKAVTFEDYLKTKDSVVNQEDKWIIEVDGKVIGTVSFYWEHKPSNWLEMGVGIYDPNYWSGGFGTRALKLLITVTSFHNQL